jgi:signal transduction histidine kinase
VLVALAVTVMVTLAFAVPLAVMVAAVAKARALSDAERQAGTVATVLLVTADPAAVTRAVQSTSAGRRQQITVHLPNARTIGATPGWADAATLQQARSVQHAITADVRGGLVRVRAAPTAGGGTSIVEVHVTDAALRRGVAKAHWVLVMLALCLLASSALLADRLAAGAVKAAQALADAAGRLGDGELDVRLTPSGPPEVARAAMAFNHLADRFLALLAVERELAADLSHRLRTPLTRLRLNAEALPPGDDRSRIMAAADALDQEIGAIIEQAQRPLVSPAAAECDLVEAAVERVAFWTELADHQGRPWSVAGLGGSVRVPASRADTVSALDSVLGNVFQHTPGGTGFQIRLDQDALTATVIVDDAGPGIAAPRKAMQRGVSGRSSTGLGMDIARRAVEGTGGRLAVAASPLGGTRVMLKFLRSDAPPPVARGTAGVRRVFTRGRRA